MALIIGLTGVKQSGKDTTAKMIIKWCARHRIHVMKETFAKPVIEKGCYILNASVDQWEELKHAMIKITMPDGSIISVSGRHAVREIGMAMISVDDNYLIDRVDAEITDTIASHPSGSTIYLVTDVRRECEAAWLEERQASGDDVHLVHMMPRMSVLADTYDSHITEQPLAVRDYSSVINNTETLTELEANVERWCETHIQPYIEDFLSE